MRRALLAMVACLALSGCGSAYINTYRGAVITKELVTEAHESQWSEPLRERAAECDTEANDTVAKLDECMAPFTKDNNDKVVKALAAYKTAASALSAILIAAEKNPDGLDKDALKQAMSDTLAAARELISLFPEAAEWMERVEMLLKGLV